jgi:O-antigen ligase
MTGLETVDIETDAGRKPGTAGIVIICVIVVVSTLLYGAVDTGTLALLSFLSFLLVAYSSLTAWRTRHVSINLDSIQLPLIALAVIGLVQLLPLGHVSLPAGLIDMPVTSSISLDPYATRFFLTRLFLYVVFFAAALRFLNSAQKLRSIVATLIAFAGLLAFYSILQRVEDPGSIYGLRQPAQAIPFGTFINRHHFAALMEMTIGLTLGILFASGIKRNRWPFAGAAAVVMAIAIMLTGSRGGVIGFITSMIAIAIFASYGKKAGLGQQNGRAFSPKLVLVGGGVFLFFTIVIVLFLGGADPLMRGAGVTGGTGDITSGRMEFWRTAVKIFLDHPTIGAGLDAFGVAYSSYDSSSGLFRVEQAHNDYLQTLADAGVVGFGCVLWFIFLLLKKGIAVIRESEPGFRRGAAVGALAGCVAILVHSFFDFPLRTPANAFVFLTLVSITLAKIPIETPSHRRPSTRPRISAR